MAFSDILWVDVMALASEMSSVAEQTRADIIAFVNSTSPTLLDAKTLRLARLFLAAHLGTISIRGSSGAAGPVTSEALGVARRSYGLVALSASNASLGSTMYGQQYLGLLAMSGAHGPFLV